MKILMVLDREFPPDIRVENEIQSLTEAGHSVHLACFTRLGRPATETTGKLMVHRKPISTLVYKSSVAALKFPYYFRFWFRFLKDITKSTSFDAIHVHDLPLASVGIRIAKLRNIKITLDLHEHWPSLLEVSTHTQSFLGKLLSSKKQWLKYEKLVCSQANNVIVISQEFKERLIKYGIEPQKIKIVSNTINLDSLKDIKTMPVADEIVLFYGGGINKHRGLETIIKAMPAIIEKVPTFKFVVAGEGSYSKVLQKLGHDLGLDDHLEFTGYLKFPVMMERLTSARIAVIPFLRNNHSDIAVPHKLFQYIAMKKPIIASNCNSIERIIKELNAGVIYQWDSPKNFADQVVMMASNLDQWEKNIGASIPGMIERYSWEVDSKRLIEIYC